MEFALKFNNVMKLDLETLTKTNQMMVDPHSSSNSSYFNKYLL